MSFKVCTISKKLKELKIDHFNGNQLNKQIISFGALSQQIMIETCCKLGVRLQMLYKITVYEMCQFRWQQVVIW